VSDWGGNTVSVRGAATREITVGTHPNALALSPSGDQLYVANGDSDSISVVDTRSDAVTSTVDLAPYRGAPVGTQPNALAVSADARALYVANAGDNDVAVVELGRRPHVEGLIPTAWYPTGVVLSHDARTLYVANAKGLGAGPNTPGGPNPTSPAP